MSPNRYETNFLDMRTITIELINEKAFQLIRELESLNLIRVRQENRLEKSNSNKFLGAMSKEDLEIVDRKLDELRSAWD